MEDKPFTKAQEFLDYLRLSNNHWGDIEDETWERGWYFRGQGNVGWPLKPKSLREGSDEDEYIRTMRENGLNDYDLMVNINKVLLTFEKQHPEYSRETLQNAEHVLKTSLSEIFIVNEFVKLTERVLGISIPDRLEWDRLSNDNYRQNPIGLIESMTKKVWLHPAMVIAQHHGIPTRLLDWTYNPVKAALFAVSDLGSSRNQGSHIVVYAIHKTHFEMSSVQPFIPPLSITSFLHAQEGLFTFDVRSNWFYVRHGRFPSLEESISASEDDVFGIMNQDKLAKKITLPMSEKDDLVRLLWLENYTIAHLMPTLNKVSDAVKLKTVSL